MPKNLMDRRKHPDYTSITAYLPKATARRLKSVVAFNDMTISEAVEEAINEWMEKVDHHDSTPTPHPNPGNSSGKG